MLHTFSNTFFLLLCSGTSYLTETEKINMKKYFYCNNSDTFLDIHNPLRDKFLQFKQTEPCRSRKEAR